jgi:hypothetical protein
MGSARYWYRDAFYAFYARVFSAIYARVFSAIKYFPQSGALAEGTSQPVSRTLLVRLSGATFDSATHV